MRANHACRSRFAFTLIELLVVISIIGVLAALLLPAIARAQYTARKSKCISQLNQFKVAIQTYRNSYDGEPPPWLSNLFPREITDEKLYLCPEDPTYGKDGGKPFWESDASRAYVETDDFEGSDADTKDPDAAAFQNPDIKGNSYIYEFCCAECSWYSPSYSWGGATATMEEVDVIWDKIHPGGGVGIVTWREIKEWELKHVGAWTPIVRCFWHTGGSFVHQDIVLNVGAKTHDVYLSDTTADGWKSHK